MLKNTDPITVTVVFAIYALVMLAIGVFLYFRNKNISDFILGDRSLNPWVAALSAQASDMSAWLLMGLPAAAYASISGAAEATWTAIGLALGTTANWIFLAKRFRRYTIVAGDALTVPDYFKNRFKTKDGGGLRLISALFILIFFTMYTASQFYAGATLFEVVFGQFGVGFNQALIIGAVIIVIYTFLGGFLAVCWTDFVQGTLMFFALLVVPVVAVFATEGVDFSVITNDLAQLMPNGAAGAVSWVVVISGLAWGLGYFGMPHIISRFMAIRSDKEVKPAGIIAVIWVVITLFAAVMVGIVGRYVFAGEPLENNDTIFMMMSDRFFPGIIVAILLSAILAAIMSTADSMLLVASSTVSEDIYKTYFRRKASDKEQIWVGRIAVLVISLIAIFLAFNEHNKEMATNKSSIIFELVSYAWAGFGSAFGPVILLSLYWKRLTGRGAIAGIVGGGLTSLIWTFKVPIFAAFMGETAAKAALTGGWMDIYAIVPGVAVSLICILLFTLTDKKPDQKILEEFEQVASGKEIG